MKILALLILLLAAAGGGYYYYENFYKKNDAQLEAEAAVIDVQLEADDADSEALMARRLEIEAKRLFPDAAENIRSRWAKTQLESMEKIQELERPASLSEAQFKRIKEAAAEGNALQFQRQLASLREQLRAVTDMERISVAGGVDTEDFNAMREKVSHRHPADYKAQRDYMEKYSEAMLRITGLKAGMPQDEFERMKSKAFSTHPEDPAEAVKYFLEQVSSKKKIEVEFSAAAYKARLAAAREDFPEDYAAQYERLKSGTTILSQKGAVALADLKNARGEPISTDQIFMMRSLSGARPATLVNIGGRKVFLMDFFLLGQGQSVVLDNGKESVTCTKISYSKDYPLVCLVPEGEPQTESALFLSEDLLERINGLPVIALGPNAFGVLNVDSVTPTVSTDKHITLDFPLRTFPKGCLLVDKDTGLYISISVTYPKLSFLPASGETHDDDLLARKSPKKRADAFKELTDALSRMEMEHRSIQKAGLSVFAKPSELAAWSAWNQKAYDEQFALLEKIHKDNRDFFGFLYHNTFEELRETPVMKPLWSKYGRELEYIAGLTKKKKPIPAAYFADFEKLLSTDVASLKAADFLPVLREEARHQLKIRGTMLSSFKEMRKNRGDFGVAPRPAN